MEYYACRMNEEYPSTTADDQEAQPDVNEHADQKDTPRPAESGGRRGPEPTRYGDWEKNGRCIDF